jgi:hypothetical protein
LPISQENLPGASSADEHHDAEQVPVGGQHNQQSPRLRRPSTE